MKTYRVVRETDVQTEMKNLLMEAVGKGLGRSRSVNEDWVAQGTQKWREGDIYIKREKLSLPQSLRFWALTSKDSSKAQPVWLSG